MDSAGTIEAFIEQKAIGLDNESHIALGDSPKMLIKYLIDDKYGSCQWPFDEETVHNIDEDIQRLKQGEPLAYITGIRHFYGFIFEVNNTVLIPRWETEELVEYAYDRIPKNSRVVDIGTGSGCIAISLALKRKDCLITAVDVSAEALQVAQKNNQRLGANVEMIKHDISSDTLVDLLGTCNVWISNPPYINRDRQLYDMKLNYEPDIALYGPDEDFLFYYKRIADLARKSNVRPLEIILELNEFYAIEISEYFSAATTFEIIKDLNAKDRILHASFL